MALWPNMLVQIALVVWSMPLQVKALVYGWTASQSLNLVIDHAVDFEQWVVYDQTGFLMWRGQREDRRRMMILAKSSILVLMVWCYFGSSVVEPEPDNHVDDRGSLKYPITVGQKRC